MNSRSARSAGRSRPTDRSIDTHVSNLRRKVGLDAKQGLVIRGIRGVGYVLNLPEPSP